ncbi:glycerol kinase GlpK [Methylococcus sp. ANG]|uniref:glycerol kinase GlpK n=1 Tax=Methylococcus sp. ANG TaxID=3231903 RepID=UPI003458CF81
MTRFVAALDQGTTSTRCILFDRWARICGRAEMEHRQFYPQPGWVEHDAAEIWRNAQAVLAGALADAGAAVEEVAALGITNQRETVVLWERQTGRPIAPAIVWQDTRTDGICRELARDGGIDRLRDRTGLPLATYFSGPKLKWLLDRVPDARARASRGELLCGTIDTWLIWNLTGGPAGGRHVTDPSNASRTLLMNLATLDWDAELLELLDIPRNLLATIRPSSERYGETRGGIEGLPVAGNLGDQQAALFGHACFEPGEAKNTYGTGCFLLLNTGPKPVPSRHGLLTTVAWRLGEAAPVYALEGSVAVAGALVQWLRDKLGLIDKAADIEALARQVEDHGGIYIVPAFSGLFAPYWRADARGAIVGLTAYAGKAHFARAALEATAYQTRDVLEAMAADAGIRFAGLKVDGGMAVNETLMQFQADILGIPVLRPRQGHQEVTALGAAFAAGLAVGFWSDCDDLRSLRQDETIFRPRMNPAACEALYKGWKKAVQRTLDWVDESPFQQ